MSDAFFRTVADQALAKFDEVMNQLGLSGGKRSGAEYLPINPTRSDQRPGSFAINRKTGAWMDGATGDKGGDLISVAAYIWNCKNQDAADRLADFLGIGKPDRKNRQPASGSRLSSERPRQATDSPAATPDSGKADECVMPIPGDAPKPPKAHPSYGQPTKTWTYFDADGRAMFYVCRFEKEGQRKEFRPQSLWRLPNGKLVWRWVGVPAPRPLYGLDKIAERPDAVVVIAEGEKAADAAGELIPDAAAISWANGANAVDKVDWKPLAGRDVLLWPDHDEAGQKAMQKVAAALASVGVVRVRIVAVNQLAMKPGGDEAGNPTLAQGDPLADGDDAADLLKRGWRAGHMKLAMSSPEFFSEPQHVLVPGKSNEQDGEPRRGRRFELRDAGVYLVDVDREGTERPRWICSPLEVVAKVRDQHNHGWGLLVSFSDSDRHPHRIIIPARAFKGEGLEVADQLLDGGLSIAPRGRQPLIEYLQTMQTDKRARVTSRTGWHEGRDGDVAFVLPDRTFSASGEEWIFESESLGTASFRSKGTLAEWKGNVSALCVGNSRLLFAVSVAFAAPLLHPSESESGGFHYCSHSSDGKTTALRVAASVCGGSDYLHRWRATDNGLESLATQHCDALLLLDELAQLDPKVAGESAYMLANGSGKTRANRTGGMRDRSFWRLLFLSAGEIGLAQHMAEAGKQARAGQELRLAEIPADAGSGLGVFEELHGESNGADFSKRLDQAAKRYYGTAWIAFIERLISDRDLVQETVRKAQRAFESSMGEQSEISGQARRVADRFALIGAAGELATEWGVTGWPPGEAARAALACFRAWLAKRGGSGKQEDRAILATVREFLQRYGESAFTDWDRPANDSDKHAPVRSDRAGYRRHDQTKDEMHYYIYPTVFKSRICKGTESSVAYRLLLKLGCIERGTENDRPWLVRPGLPTEQRTRVIHVLPSIWDAGDD